VGFLLLAHVNNFIFTLGEACARLHNLQAPFSSNPLIQEMRRVLAIYA